MSEELTEIEKLLKHHDWWYHYSDDGGAFRRGEESSQKLRNACRAAKDQEKTKELWDKYCPTGTKSYYDGTPRK